VTQPDGSSVDVHLDRSFHVINAHGDGSGADEGGANDD
jgi:hypothetical protein